MCLTALCQRVNMYSRIKYDIFFKKIFQQEPLLKAFLNTVLADELRAPIAQLTYRPTEFIPHAERHALNQLKHAIIDVFVTTEDGTRALVEIQKGTEKSDLLRFIDYQCRNFSHQFRVGDDYKNPVACYSVCWLFDMTPPHQELKEKLTIRSDKPATDWAATWEIIAIYPRCIRPEHLASKSLDDLEEWLLLDVVSNAKNAQNIKDLVHNNAVREAFQQLDISGLTEEELSEVEFEEAVTGQYKQTFEKRLQKAKAENEKEKALAIAKNLLDILDIDTICQKTGLNKEEVLELARQ